MSKVAQLKQQLLSGAGGEKQQQPNAANAAEEK
jgi:hypothetical protein